MIRDDNQKHGCNYTGDHSGVARIPGREILVCEYCEGDGPRILLLAPDVASEIGQHVARYQRYDQDGKPRRFLADVLARVAHVHGWTFVPCAPDEYGANATGYRACCPECRARRQEQVADDLRRAAGKGKDRGKD